MQNKIIWVTWEWQRRNRELCKALNIKLFEFAEIDAINNHFNKYLSGITRTLKLIKQEKPSLIICQNPSIILSLTVILIRKIFRIPVCVDAHNAGLFPMDGRSFFLNYLSRFIQRNADMTFVTNAHLKSHVERNAGHAFILPDPIPDLPKGGKKTLKGSNNLLFICSFGSDEPYQAVFEASKHINSNTVIYVTGDCRKIRIEKNTLPENLILTGYLPESDYIEMLNSVDATIDLTDRENCLVCGAYESLAVEKPLVLSNTKALREYFSMGAVYTDNTAESIRNAIYEVIARKDELRDKIKELKNVRTREWEGRKKELKTILANLIK